MVLLLWSGFAVAAGAAEIAVPPAPSAWVTDTAAFLSAGTVDALDARLRAYQATTGHQVLVYVSATTGATPTEEWTSRAFQRWKIGRKGIDDGLVMFVFPADRKVRIEVGYGLEQSVPDAVAARIIRDTITPQLRAGHTEGAVTSGVDALLAAIGGEAAPPAATAEPAGNAGDAGDADQSPASVALGVIIALLIVAGIVLLIRKLPGGRTPYIRGRNSGFGLWDVLSIGGSLLGGGSSGGGFSGGGGMGGGGGATGSW